MSGLRTSSASKVALVKPSQPIPLIHILALALIVLIGGASVSAQETYFGKNKVIYRIFEWQFIQSDHFDVYFYDEQYELAKFTAETMEEDLLVIEDQLDYTLKSRIPVFIYLSANDMQTTNILPGILPEGVNGFTEAFKKRVVVHFNGSFADYDHLIHHELTHAVIYDLIFGGSFSSIISRQRFFNLPLWFAEGYAEYSSRDHWHYRSDMIVRDATINSYLRPPGVMGILAYTEGSMLVRYIADTYGEEKLGEILRKGKILLSIKRAVKAATGVEIKKLWADYQLYLKQRYWPEIAERKMPDKISKQLTKHGRDGSYFNEKPAFSPNGDVIAIFSDRADYTEIFLISATDGRVVKKVTKASRSGDLESLHSFFSGITFSPDGEKLCFVAKSNGYDALFFMNIANRKVYLKKRVNAYGLLSPIWSPEGDRVAFSALMNGRRDMFIFDIEQDILTPLTNDLHDDRDASWMLDGRTLVFSSDRPHPENNEERDVQVDLTGNFLEAGGGPLRFGAYNLFTLNIDTREVTPLPVGEGHNIEPSVSPDGKKIVFVSNRNGIDNLYLHYFDSTGAIAITDLLTGAGSPSWAPTGKKIAFSSFNSGGFDVFLLEDIFPAGNQGELELTDFYLGKFRKDYVELDASDEELNLDAPIWSPKTLGWEESGGEKQKPPVSLVADSESGGVATITTDTSGITSDGDFVFVSGPSKTASDGDKGSDTDNADNGEKGQSEREDLEYDPFAPSQGGDPLSPLLTDVPDDDLDGVNRGRFDGRDELSSIQDNRDGDEYVVKPYKVKFTPDFVAGGLNFDSFFGLRSQGFFLLSDYLGNRQILIGADVSGDIDRSNVQAYYFDNTRRTRLGTGLFHTKNFYLDNRSRLFSDRFFGATGLASYPFSTFSRVDLSATLTFVSRNYHNTIELRDSRTTRAATLGLSYTHDNVLWGLTGPVNGGRSKLTFSVAKDFFSNTHRVFRVPNPRSRNDSIAVAEIFRENPNASLDSTVSALSYLAVELDHRRYWHIGGQFSAAFRFSAGGSVGTTPKRYFLGGTTNWLGNRIDNAEAFDVENLYFADVVTPLRGYDYYELSGTRYFLTNIEFRYPFIDYLKLHFPLPIALARVQGAMFFDFGATWDGDNFRFASNQGGFHLQDTRAGFGWGLRANLGFLLLRYDMAWATNLNTIADKPTSYFSFGADF